MAPEPDHAVADGGRGELAPGGERLEAGRGHDVRLALDVVQPGAGARDDFLAVALSASHNWGIAVGEDGLMAAGSQNFQNWYRQRNPTPERLNAVVIDRQSNTALAAGEGGTIVASSDQGRTWDFIERRSPNEINAVAFNGQVALFAGENATLLRGEVPEGKQAEHMQVDVISSGFEQHHKNETLTRQCS